MNKKENGITLVSLIITVILLIILASITIHGALGDEGIVDTTIATKDEFEVIQKKEQIEQLVENIIMSYEYLGETNGIITALVDEIKEESWVKNTALSANNDILITTNDGYLYEVYYDESYGQKFIEYLGREENSIPTITSATYNRTNKVIDIVSQGVATTEIIYKEEVIQNSNISAAGWYTVKCTASSGNVRYAWVRITSASSNIAKPTMVITPNQASENGWYTQPVSIEINVETGNDLYYKTDASSEYTKANSLPATVRMNNEGIMNIYAYAEDSLGNQSEPKHSYIKFDRTRPTINVSIAPELEEGQTWYKENVVISLKNSQDSITNTDDISGIDGYYYWEVVEGQTASQIEASRVFVKGNERTITIASDGDRTLAFKVKDRAGNESETRTIQIKKDTVPPENFVPRIINETSNSFTILAETQDSESGIDYYNFYVDGDLIEQNPNNTTGICNVSDLTEEKNNFLVYVEAIDNAGNIKESSRVTAYTGGL